MVPGLPACRGGRPTPAGAPLRLPGHVLGGAPEEQPGPTPAPAVAGCAQRPHRADWEGHGRKDSL